MSRRKPGDELMIGSTIWTDYDELMWAQYLELFLNWEETGYWVALWQARIIDPPTE